MHNEGGGVMSNVHKFKNHQMKICVLKLFCDFKDYHFYYSYH